jgi:hypothetical protein
MASDSDRGGQPAGTRDGAPRDRRGGPRAAIEIPAVLHMGTRALACSIRDVSIQGIGLAVGESVAPGMVVRIVFRLPSSPQPIEVAATLARVAGSRNERVVGLQFVEPSADALHAIGTFVSRNRSDQPFSHRRRAADGGAGAEADESDSSASLAKLYERAVSDVENKPPKRGGLLDRWLRRDKS